MINHFIAGNDEKQRSLRDKLIREYEEFKTGTGLYSSMFAENRQEEKDQSELLTINDITSWLKSTGGHNSRLAWWKTWRKNSVLFREITRPLLSLRSSGSMTVERVAKPLKNSVYTKERRAMLGGKTAVLLRAGLNLNFLSQAKQCLKQNLI